MSPRPVLATKSLLQNAFGAMLKGENVLLQNAQYGNLSFNMHCSWRFWQVDVPRFCNELFSRNSILSYNVGAPLLYTYKTACATPPWTSEGARKNAVRETLDQGLHQPFERARTCTSRHCRYVSWYILGCFQK